MNTTKNWFVKNDNGTITFTLPYIDDPDENGECAYNELMTSLVGAVYDCVKNRFDTDKEDNKLMTYENTVNFLDNCDGWFDGIDNEVNEDVDMINDWEKE